MCSGGAISLWPHNSYGFGLYEGEHEVILSERFPGLPERDINGMRIKTGLSDPGTVEYKMHYIHLRKEVDS